MRKMPGMRDATVLVLLTILCVNAPASGAQFKQGSSDAPGIRSSQGTPTQTATMSAGSAGTSTRPRIAVLAFGNPARFPNTTIGEGFASLIASRLVLSGRFEIVQHGEDLEAPAEETGAPTSGYVDAETAVELGSILGVEYILCGEVTDFSFEESSFRGVREETARVQLDFSLVDTETGLPLLEAVAEGTETGSDMPLGGTDLSTWLSGVSFGTDEFLDSMIGRTTATAVDSLAVQILELFPIQAAVVAVSEDFVVIDVGSAGGVDIGMEFEVFRVSPVTDSSGDVVWEDRILIGRVLVSAVDLTNAKADIVSGSDFMEGDLCLLVSAAGAAESGT